jgi:hypothetical protein
MTLLRDHGLNLVVEVAYEDGGRHDGGIVGVFRKEGVGDLPLGFAHGGAGVYRAVAPQVEGTLEVTPEGSIGYAPVVVDVAPPQRLRVEIARPGTIVIVQPSRTGLPAQFFWTPMVQQRVDGGWREPAGAPHGFGELANAHPGRWHIRLSPGWTGADPPREWLSKMGASGEFDLPPGGRLVIELVDGGLRAR